MGLRRNLSAAQIVGQVLHAKRLLAAEGAAPIDNIVFMGMGEPLHNLEAVLSAVDILVDEAGFAFSRNKVTVSTSGLVPPLRRFLAESPACLAVSLNATTEAVRSWIMVRRRGTFWESIHAWLLTHAAAAGEPQALAGGAAGGAARVVPAARRRARAGQGVL